MKYKIGYKLDNWNETISKCRGNKFGANATKKKEMQVVEYYLRNIKKIKKYPIELKFTWHVKNINSDLDNKSVKSILDAMQKMGILENDNIKHIPKITYVAIKDISDFVELEVKEYKG